MEIRDATFQDLEAVLPIMHKAHEQSVFKDLDMSEVAVQRNYVTAICFDDGFAKVVEHKGKVTGCMVGLMAESHFGQRYAQDLFLYSVGGTDKLVKAFCLWARDRGARFVQITDMSESQRYQNLLTTLGLKPCGTNFVGVI